MVNHGTLPVRAGRLTVPGRVGSVTTCGPRYTDGAMRLTDREREVIVETARAHFGEVCRVTLFGSRAYDSRRGGDIDLLIDTPMDYATAARRITTFLVALKRRIGDRKIDVVLRTPDAATQPVHEVADSEGVHL